MVYHIEKLHTEVFWTLLWIVSVVSKVIHHRRQIRKGLRTVMFLSAVLDLASRFHKSLPDLVTLTFSEKKSRKLLVSWVRLFCTSDNSCWTVSIFKAARTGKDVLMLSNTVLPALPCEPSGESKEEQYLVRPCVFFWGDRQVLLLPSTLCKPACVTFLWQFSVARVVAYLSLQCSKEEFFRTFFFVLCQAGSCLVFSLFALQLSSCPSSG